MKLFLFYLFSPSQKAFSFFSLRLDNNRVPILFLFFLPVPLNVPRPFITASFDPRNDLVDYDPPQERRMLNITTNDIKVWHISENEKNELERTSASQFFSGETYVVRWYYHVTATGRTLKVSFSQKVFWFLCVEKILLSFEFNIIGPFVGWLQGTPSRHNVTGRSRVAYFFWQGSHSSLSDKGVSALMTVELDEERGPHVRVSMGFESPAFLNLFNGALIVFKGKRENMEEVSTRRLFLVRGEHPSEANLLEIEFSPSHLRSRGCVVAVTTEAVYLWIGSKAPSHTKEVSKAYFFFLIPPRVYFN